MSDFEFFDNDIGHFDDLENDYEWNAKLSGALAAAAQEEMQQHPPEIFSVILAEYGFEVPFTVLINGLKARKELEG